MQSPKKGTAKAKPKSKPVHYSQKISVGTDKDYAGKSQSANSMIKAYKTTPSGKVISTSKESKRASTVGGNKTTSYPQSTTVLDTTGYSKGKKSFPAKKATYNVADFDYNTLDGKRTYEKFDVARKDVKPAIERMKSNSGASKTPGTTKNTNSGGTTTTVTKSKDGNKYTKVTTKEGKTYNSVKKMKDGGPTTTKSKNGVTTKEKVAGVLKPDMTHKGKKGMTSSSIDGLRTVHKGSKGVTENYNNVGGSYTMHKGAKGNTIVTKDNNKGEKIVMYQSNKNKNTYTKTSKLKKGGSVKKK